MREVAASSVMGISYLLFLLLEIATIILTISYLLDKGWDLILAVIIGFSIIGTIITVLYAAFADGYWTLLLLMASGIAVQGVAAAVAAFAEE